ncbi:hypothetical protein [Rhodococcus sp. NPDC058521]|uniref:hypothetical protein n=1 Tax=Rhodococcus sp. NPDC058521 TaxID=3346536 RepID=UPI00366564FC
MTTSLERPEALDGDYRRSLALCIIESVQSHHGRDEVSVVDRYLAYRRARESDLAPYAEPLTDGARALLRTFEEAGSSDQWAGKVASYKRRYSATGAPIEARHIQQAAALLYDRRIDSISDLFDAARDQAALENLHDAWVEVCGAEEDDTWSRFLTLAGIGLPRQAVQTLAS